jgi:Txe/YoeB family toxin of toxin-antitoxin system
MTYKVKIHSRAQKDLLLLERDGKSYSRKAEMILEALSQDPYQKTFDFEVLSGNAEGLLSMRISIKDRVLYRVLPSEDPDYEGIVAVISMRGHYKLRGILSTILL